MAYRIQIFHPESGFYLNTNHAAANLDELKRLMESSAFSGVRLQVVDDDGAVCYGPTTRQRETPLSIADLASVLGVPVLERFEFPGDGDSLDG